MAVLPIYVYDQAVLKRKARPVQKVDENLVKFVEDMFETMRKANGIGLAANQVGSLQRVVVIDVAGMEGMEDAKPLTLLNPRIVEEEGEVTMEEGCLSLPELRDEVDRPEKVTVEYQDLALQTKSIEADGILARVLQHEIDHLNGVLFIDRLGTVKRKLLRGRLNKILKGEVEANYPIIVSAQHQSPHALMNSPPTRIVFMGTPDFAVPSLDILIRNHFLIPAVVTAPDKPRGRGQELSPTPIKERAGAAGIPVLQPEQLNDPAFVSRLKEIAPDLIVVVAFRILPREVFTIPRLGAFNLHASLLPKYRGAAPINWAIINGERETGVTTFLLEDKVDTGGIVLQRSVPIDPDDNAGTVHDRLAGLGAEVVLDTVRKIEQGKVEVIRQDNALASRAPKIFKEDCRINWQQPAPRLHNFIRGLSPYPAAFTMHNGKNLKVFRTTLSDRGGRGVPGEVTVHGEEIIVAASEGGILLLELQQEGRRRMTTAEFLRGYGMKTGDKLL